MMMAKAMSSPLASPSVLLQRSSSTSLPCMLTRSKSFGFASSAFLCNSGLLNAHRQSINSPRSIAAIGRQSLAPIASASVSTTAAPISVGQKLPEATFAYLDKDGQVQTVSVSDLTKGKKAVFLAVPGAFTPTCSQKHLPGFVEKADELRAKGVDTIACISVNDAFVMRAWGESIGVGDKVLLLSDGNLGFTKAMGATLDLSDKPVGLGVRSRRYSLLAEDGIVKVLHLEEGGSFTISGAEDILKAL